MLDILGTIQPLYSWDLFYLHLFNNSTAPTAVETAATALPTAESRSLQLVSPVVLYPELIYQKVCVCWRSLSRGGKS